MCYCYETEIRISSKYTTHSTLWVVSQYAVTTIEYIEQQHTDTLRALNDGRVYMYPLIILCVPP